MSEAIAVHHGAYGRCGLFKLNKSLPTHAHLESHLIFFLGGEAAYSKVGDSVYTLDNETVIAVNPLQPHSGEFGRHGGESLVVVMYIKPAWVAEMGSGDSPLRFEKNAISVTPEIENLIEQFGQQIRNSSNSDILLPLIYRLTQACALQSAGLEKQLLGDKLAQLSDSRIVKSVRLLHYHLRDDVPPEHIASEVGLSRPHFYKLFREHVGVTPSVYQNTLKIDAAIERLTNSDLPVNSIGHELGFASPASFSRFFTANVGIPPIAYRRVASVEAGKALA